MALGVLLAGCSMVPPTPPSITNRISDGFTPDRLVYCFGHDCQRNQTVTFTPAHWQTMRDLFADPSADAEEERRNIRAAIGYLERIAGAQAGTTADEGGTMPVGYDLGPPQLDCYDEAINTSNFLGLMARDGLLRHHRVEGPEQRVFVNGDIIHATGVVRHVASGRRYAVDSSFFRNGEQASVVPLELWVEGWAPPEQTAVASN